MKNVKSKIIFPIKYIHTRGSQDRHGACMTSRPSAEGAAQKLFCTPLCAASSRLNLYPIDYPELTLGATHCWRSAPLRRRKRLSSSQTILLKDKTGLFYDQASLIYDKSIVFCPKQDCFTTKQVCFMAKQSCLVLNKIAS